MRIAVATNCTNRKRFEPTRALQGKYLPTRPVKDIAEEWVRRVRNSSSVTSATDLYQGRSFTEAKTTASVLGAEFYVISAGLGLINGARQVPSYSLSISQWSSDNVLRRCIEKNVQPEYWWRLINSRFHAQSLASRIALSGYDYWLIAVPSTYYKMVRDDLGRLAEADLACVRLFGPRRRVTSDRVLEKTLIEIDDRLDGPDSDVRGTRSDFPQRAMSFFSRNVLTELPDADVISHRKATARLLRQMKVPKTPPQRISLSDEQICKKLDQFWRKGDGQSTKLLRVLRDDLLIACEESRFRRLYHLVAQWRGVE